MDNLDVRDRSPSTEFTHTQTYMKYIVSLYVLQLGQIAYSESVTEDSACEPRTTRRTTNPCAKAILGGTRCLPLHKVWGYGGRA